MLVGRDDSARRYTQGRRYTQIHRYTQEPRIIKTAPSGGKVMPSFGKGKERENIFLIFFVLRKGNVTFVETHHLKVWKTSDSSTYLPSQTNSAFCILHSAFKSFRTPHSAFILHSAFCILHCAAGALIPHSALRTHSAFHTPHSALRLRRLLFHKISNSMIKIQLLSDNNSINLKTKRKAMT